MWASRGLFVGVFGASIVLLQGKQQLTWRTIEEIGSVQQVGVLYVAEALVTIHVAVTDVVLHLSRFYHLQPLRVVPTEFLQLDFLRPFLIIFLEDSVSPTVQ